jgi:hydrogenase nickel incorporation protein HypB
MSAEPRLVEVRKNVLKQNDVIARGLRERFREAGVLAVSLVSSPGSGKTAFLEKTLTALHSRYKVAALVGDLATENDAARLARSQAPVKQIITGTVCHLEAAMVQNALADWDPTIFNSADVAIITKLDLASAVEFDEAAARRNIQAVRPGMEILKLSAKTGEGMEEYLEFLERKRTRARDAAVAHK